MMKIKKVQATSIQEALAEIRREFGPDAIILHTKQLRNNRVDSSGPQVEVTAGIDQEPDTSSEVKREQPRQAPVHASPTANEDLHNQMERMQKLIEHLTQELQYPDVQNLPLAYRETYLHLVQQEVESRAAKVLIKDSRDYLGDHADQEEIIAYLQESIEKRFTQDSTQAFQSQGQKVIVLVGPTGVGKTTTIAKLATQKSVEEGRSVALITADTFRVAAADQLRVFADLLDLPLEVVYTPTEMKKALEKFQDYDYVYIDTTGRSQKDHDNLKSIHQLIKAASPDEIHLLLGASTSKSTLLQITEKFSLFEITDVLITKVDEAETVGNLYSLFEKFQLPISYFTNGQNVPEDIYIGNISAYCHLLFEALYE